MEEYLPLWFFYRSPLTDGVDNAYKLTETFFWIQISATALEETKVLVWHRDKLKLTLMERPYLHTVFEHIIARDVVRKLTQVITFYIKIV